MLAEHRFFVLVNRFKTARAFLRFKSFQLYSKTKRTPLCEVLSVFGRGERMHLASQSAMFGDPNAKHFGTRLHITRLKTIINRFKTARAFLRFKSFSTNKNKSHTMYDSCFLVGVTGFEPATSSSRTMRATKLRYTPKTYFKNYSTTL